MSERWIREQEEGKRWCGCAMIERERAKRCQLNILISCPKQCGGDTSRLRYQCLTKNDICVCAACFASGHFPIEATQADFTKVRNEGRDGRDGRDGRMRDER